jgi:hypothetical protein
MELSPYIRITICAILLLIPRAADAQFDIDWFAVAGGGGTSSGGDFELTATIGQHDAGDLSGDNFTIIGGFWGILAVFETPGAPSLSVRVANNNVVISWPENGSQGFALEEAVALANASWTTVNATPQASNGTNRVDLPLPVGNRFYRLSKP